MKSKVLSFFMAFTIFFMSQVLTTPKADAAIGVIFKKKVLRTVGGIGIGTGVGAFTGGLLLAELGVVSFSLGGGIILTLSSILSAGLGLIVLDDKTVIDLEFHQIDLLDTKAREKFSLAEIQMYNAELEELNAIRKTIQEEVGSSGTLKKANKLWNEYKEMLHPSTSKVAQAMALNFVTKLKKR